MPAHPLLPAVPQDGFENDVDVVINAATRIMKESDVWEVLIDTEYCNDGNPTYTGQKVLEFCEEWMEECSDLYDEQWYSIVAVKEIRMTVNWNYLAEFINDLLVDIKIEEMFLGGLRAAI
jgi:hypothetical protein